MKINHHSLIHSLEKGEKGIALPVFIIVLLLVSAIGIGVGYGLAQFKKPSTQTKTLKVNNEKSSGIADKKTFKDQALGVLREGGIDGEGNFHLERPGGPSQDVYLTSSAVDLSLYIGKKIRVHGATFKGQKTGWLMDVGLVEVL